MLSLEEMLPDGVWRALRGVIWAVKIREWAGCGFFCQAQIVWSLRLTVVARVVSWLILRLSLIFRVG